MVIDMKLLDWVKNKFQYEEIDVFDPEYIDTVTAKAMTYTEYQDRKRKLAILQKLEKIKRGKK